ncbi:YadA-like family protein [Bartonella sp. A05]|uniref:YadA-like family protein n=1 Tax=Bartonella sp. A05 TaxID=2967261 RepID=UPI0022A99C37|nr:YadA-like family protein [Bartonella sp. A05]MCZ2204105.1 YadA-like family protein [Bartonella sp. A05]
MNKSYIKQKENDLNCHRSSYYRLPFAAIALLLSSISPVFAAAPVFTSTPAQRTNGSNEVGQQENHENNQQKSHENLVLVDEESHPEKEESHPEKQVSSQDQSNKITVTSTATSKEADSTKWQSDYTTSSLGFMDDIVNSLGIVNALDSRSYAPNHSSRTLDENALNISETWKSDDVSNDFNISRPIPNPANEMWNRGSMILSIKKNHTLLGVAAKAGPDSVSIGTSAKAEQWSVAVGTDATAGQSSVALGESTQSTNQAIAIGNRVKADFYGVAVGVSTTATEFATSIGSNSRAQKRGTSLGYNASAGFWSVAIGSLTITDTDFGTALGTSTEVTSPSGVAIGYLSLGNRQSGIAGYDPLSQLHSPSNNKDIAWIASKAAVSIGNSDKNITRQIIGLSAGTHDTDAVNVAQLKALEIKLDNSVADVKKQVDKNSNAIQEINSQIDTSAQNGETPQEIVDGFVAYEKDEEGKKTNTIKLIGGDEGQPVTIDNIADGAITTDSKEAVNGSQLYDVAQKANAYTDQQIKEKLDAAVLEANKELVETAVSTVVGEKFKDYDQKISEFDGKIAGLTQRMEETSNEAKQAAAVGLAVANLRYNDTPGTLSISVGAGLWRSQTAFAVGAGFTSSNGKILSNLSATTAGGNFGFGAGLTFSF